MTHLLTDQLRMMAEHVGDEIAYTDVAADLDLTFGAWEARSNQLARRHFLRHHVDKTTTDCRKNGWFRRR
jgi:hypothetical protein